MSSRVLSAYFKLAVCCHRVFPCSTLPTKVHPRQIALGTRYQVPVPVSTKYWYRHHRSYYIDNSSMNWIRNNHGVVGTALLGAAATGSVALSTLYFSKRKQQAIRRATLACNCGKVKAEIYQPAANYKYAETTCVQCGCHDCVAYCKAVRCLCLCFWFKCDSIFWLTEYILNHKLILRVGFGCWVLR